MENWSLSQPQIIGQYPISNTIPTIIHDIQKKRNPMCTPALLWQNTPWGGTKSFENFFVWLWPVVSVYMHQMIRDLMLAPFLWNS